MTSFVNFFVNAWDASGSTTLPTTGTTVATLRQIVGLPSPDNIVLAHIMASNTAAGSPGVPTFSDNMNLTWTALRSDTYDGTNGTRHSVYWARAPFRGRLNVTVTLDGGSNVSLAQLSLITVRGAHLTAPQDLNANSIKAENHVASATSSISGFSTTSANSIVFAFYGSRTNATDVGDPASHTVLYDRSANCRLQATYQQFTSAQTGISVSVLNPSTTGSLIVVALRPRDTLRKEILWMQGFEQYIDGILGLNQAGSLGDTNSEFSMSSSSGTRSLVQGRDGVGKALRCEGGGSSGDLTRLSLRSTSGFGVRNPNMINSGFSYDDTVDGDHVYFGFNWKVGTVIGANALTQPRFAQFGFVNNGTLDRTCFTYNLSTTAWGMTLVPGTSGITSPSTITPDVLVIPDYDPYQRWVWIELHLYRHASAGRIEMWQESLPFKAGLQGGTAGKRGTAGGHKSRHRSWRTAGKPLQDQPEATLAKIFDYTGDTSVATLGAINGFAWFGDNHGSGQNIGCDLDDIVFSIGDRMRGPCYVRTFPVRSTVSNTNHGSVVYPPTEAELTSGGSVTTLTDTINVVAGDLIIASVLAENSTDTPPAFAISSMVDSQGNTYTNIANVAYIDTSFTPDLQCRNAVYWARAASSGILTITVTVPTLDVINLSSMVVRTNDAAPLDTNVNSIKTESHNTSATSSVSGFTTDASAELIVAVYSSPRNTSPGTFASGTFTLQVDKDGSGTLGNAVQQQILTKVMSGAESGATFSWSGATIAGSLIVFCLKNAALALDTHKSNMGYGNQLYEAVNDGHFDINNYIVAYAGNPRTVFDFNNDGLGYTPRSVWAVGATALVHGEGDTLDGGISIQHTVELLSNSVINKSFYINVGTASLLHRWSNVTTNYDPNTLASWSYTAARAAQMAVDIPDVWYDQETVNRIFGERRTFICYKTMVISQMVGNGAGGVPDTPGSPGYIGGDTDYSGVPITVCFHGIDEGCGPHGYAAELHGIDEGIVL